MTSSVSMPCSKCKERYPLDEMRGNCHTGYVCHECIWLELQVLRMKFQHLITLGLLNSKGEVKPRKPTPAPA